jgi:hypothetical protein
MSKSIGEVISGAVSAVAKFGIIVVVVGAAGIAVLVGLDAYNDAQQRKVVVSVAYDLKACGTMFPLFVTIHNGSNKTVSKVSWKMAAYEPGHSTNLARNPEPGFDSDYTSDPDTIINAGERSLNCYALPRFTISSRPEKLQYGAEWSSARFQDTPRLGPLPEFWREDEIVRDSMPKAEPWEAKLTRDGKIIALAKIGGKMPCPLESDELFLPMGMKHSDIKWDSCIK